MKDNYIKYIVETEPTLAVKGLTVLKVARERLKKGWMKRSYMDGESPEVSKKFCLLGSTWQDDGVGQEVAYNCMKDTLARSTSSKRKRYIRIPDFNDAPETTHRQVLDFTRRIINKLERKLKEKGVL